MRKSVPLPNYKTIIRERIGETRGGGGREKERKKERQGEGKGEEERARERDKHITKYIKSMK